MKKVYKLDSQINVDELKKSFALISAGEFYASECDDSLYLNIIQSNPNYNKVIKLEKPDDYIKSNKSGYIYIYQNKSVIGSSYTELYIEYITPIRMTKNDELDYSRVSFVEVTGEDLSSYSLPEYFTDYNPTECTDTYNDELADYISSSFRPSGMQTKIDGAYIGEAVVGLSEDSPGWKITYTSDELVTYPNHDDRYIFKWSDRASYNYL